MSSTQGPSHSATYSAETPRWDDADPINATTVMTIPFLSLPVEIRFMIYEHYFVRPGWSLVKLRWQRGEYDLLHTCRQACLEGLPIYYSKNKFHLQTTFSLTHYINYIRQWLVKPQLDERHELLRHLKIDFLGNLENAIGHDSLREFQLLAARPFPMPDPFRVLPARPFALPDSFRVRHRLTSDPLDQFDLDPYLDPPEFPRIEIEHPLYNVLSTVIPQMEYWWGSDVAFTLGLLRRCPRLETLHVLLPGRNAADVRDLFNEELFYKYDGIVRALSSVRVSKLLTIGHTIAYNEVATVARQMKVQKARMYWRYEDLEMLLDRPAHLYGSWAWCEEEMKEAGWKVRRVRSETYPTSAVLRLSGDERDDVSVDSLDDNVTETSWVSASDGGSVEAFPFSDEDLSDDLPGESSEEDDAGGAEGTEGADPEGITE